MPTTSVDRAAFERLVRAAIIDRDMDGVVAALDEIKMVQGDRDAGGIILLARKRARGVGDVEREGEQYPAAGLRVGSTLHKPLPA